MSLASFVTIASAERARPDADCIDGGSGAAAI
jgi:hypothetical protein